MTRRALIEIRLARQRAVRQLEQDDSHLEKALTKKSMAALFNLDRYTL